VDLALTLCPHSAYCYIDKESDHTRGRRTDSSACTGFRCGLVVTVIRYSRLNLNDVFVMDTEELGKYGTNIIKHIKM
jgi:hypothetical protein